MLNVASGLVPMQICLLGQAWLVDQRDAQREVVLVPLYAGGAHHDDGGGVRGIVQLVGLDDESRAVSFARLFLVRLRLQVDLPDLSALKRGHRSKSPRSIR